MFSKGNGYYGTQQSTHPALIQPLIEHVEHNFHKFEVVICGVTVFVELWQDRWSFAHIRNAGYIIPEHAYLVALLGAEFASLGRVTNIGISTERGE